MTLPWLLGAVLAMPLQSAHAQNRLVLLNWDDYLDDTLVQEFERQYEATVIQVLFSSEEDRTSRLASGDGRGYDLILTSGVDLSTYVKRGWIARLDAGKVPNLRHINPRLRDAFPHARDYAIPYCSGTLGIVYRHDLVQEPISSWQQLYQPAPELHGKINLLEDGRDLIGMGLKSLGYSANSNNSAQLQEVESLLLAQKSFVRSYAYPSAGADSELVRGDLVVTMAYNSDALSAMDYSDKLTYVVPEEGGNVWIDYLAVATKSRNPELAHQFLDFLNEPGNAAALAESIYCATANSAAEELLPASFRENPLVYPSTTDLNGSEYYQPITGRALRKRNQITTRVLR